MPQTQSAQIVFAQDEQSTLPKNLQVLVQAYEAWQYAQESLEQVNKSTLPEHIIETLGSKEQIQDALAISINTLSQMLNKCSEQDIENADIDSEVKQKLKSLRRTQELELFRKSPRHELER